ncbi:putative inorganic phosphate cotransporter isoform X2 [Planococcus citri]|uniref:putative inorganic phosphate cotransporter isoform X2 n=1 Tax=Planococcus citri TaxID=170843 RepID=UPI0031F7A15F
MILTTKVRKRVFQVFFVFLFLSIQSFLREAIKIGYHVMTDRPEKYFVIGKYDWQSSTLFKAQIGFSMLHVIMQIPAGMWAQQYGAKVVMQLSMLYCASISFVTPFAIIFGGPITLIVFVSLQGLGQGCFIPSFYVFTSQWVPLQHRSFIFSAAFGGLHFGTAVGIPIIDTICHTKLGWLSGYILSALMGLSWVICSVYTMKSWVIRERISMNTRDQYDTIFEVIDISEKGVTISVPWKRIMTSIPFWSTMLDHFGSVWISGVFLQDHAFLNRHHHMQSVHDDFATLNLLSFIMIFVYGSIMISTKRFNFQRITRRRVMSSIALWGGSILLFIISAFKPKNTICRIIYLMGAAFSASAYCGVFLNHDELSPFFAGTLMGISNVVGNTANIFRSLVQNYIVTNPDSNDQWRLNFLASSTVVFFANLPFVMYGSSDEQPWSPKFDYAYYEEEEEDNSSNPQIVEGRGRRATLQEDKPTSSLSKSKSTKKHLKTKKTKKHSNKALRLPKKKSRLVHKRWKK